MNKEEIKNRLEEIKIEKKQLKKQLNEIPSLEVGWYKSDMFNEWLAYFDGVSYIYGFRPIYGNWFNENLNCKPTDLDVKATDKEVETALIKEAKKRKCDKYKEIKSFFGGISEAGKPMYYDGYIPKDNEFWINRLCVFKQGKWATIIKPNTIHLEKGDYTVKELNIEINKLNK